MKTYHKTTKTAKYSSHNWFKTGQVFKRKCPTAKVTLLGDRGKAHILNYMYKHKQDTSYVNNSHSRTRLFKFDAVVLNEAKAIRDEAEKSQYCNGETELN